MTEEKPDGQRSGLPKEVDVVERSGAEFVQIPPAPPYHGLTPRLKGKTPAEGAEIKVNGENRWLTLIQNAKREAAMS